MTVNQDDKKKATEPILIRNASENNLRNSSGKGLLPVPYQEEIIPFKEVRSNKQRFESAALVVVDHLEKFPWKEIATTGGQVISYSAIGLGKATVFVLTDVIPFVIINSFKFVSFIIKLSVFFVADIAKEFKKTKPVKIDNDNVGQSGQNQNIVINDNHGTINIFNR